MTKKNCQEEQNVKDEIILSLYWLLCDQCFHHTQRGGHRIVHQQRFEVCSLHGNFWSKNCNYKEGGSMNIKSRPKNFTTKKALCMLMLAWYPATINLSILLCSSKINPVWLRWKCDLWCSCLLYTSRRCYWETDNYPVPWKELRRNYYYFILDHTS